MRNCASTEQGDFGQAKVSPEPDVEIIVHIDEPLDEYCREQLKALVAEINGINEAEFCTGRLQLMFVAYDPELTSSRAVLDQVLHQGLHAELVGPM